MRVDDNLYFGGYVFHVYSDGSLACAFQDPSGSLARYWFEDPPTAAKELSLDADALSAKVIRTIEAWRDARLKAR